MSLGHVAEHPLIAKLLEAIKPITLAAVDKIGERIEKDQVARLSEGALTLPEGQHYDVIVFKRSSALINALETISEVQHFIQFLPPASELRKLRISQERWVDYHYSYHLIIMAGLVDLALLLTNDIFRIGHPEKLCSPRAIKENYWVRQTSVVHAIEMLERITQSHRDSRNLFVHRGIKPDVTKATSSELYDLMTFVAQANALTQGQIGTDELFDQGFKLEIEKLNTRMRNDGNNASEGVHALFDALLPVYETQATKLKT